MAIGKPAKIRCYNISMSSSSTARGYPVRLSNPFPVFLYSHAFITTGPIPHLEQCCRQYPGSLKLPEPLCDSQTSIEKALHDVVIAIYKNLRYRFKTYHSFSGSPGHFGRGGRRTALLQELCTRLMLYVVAGNVTGFSARHLFLRPAANMSLSRIAGRTTQE